MTDDAERWRRAGELFDRLLEISDRDQRERLLRSECGSDNALQVCVQRLLQADADATHLDRGVGAIAGELLRQQSDAARVGQRFGAYRIERPIGRGGMGEVYLARREGADFEQHVALKLMRTGSGGNDGHRRFLAERRLLARLEHPNIARLYDGGFAEDGQPWYAMQHIDGAPLTAYCDAMRMPLPARLRLFAKVCEAVAHAHRHLIVHRDLKPGNVLVDARGEPHLLDFGIAKLLVSEDADSGAETALMTPEYAAPEQLRGEAVSIATDVYALGAVLFELLTGQRPFADALAPRDPPLASRACAEGAPRLAERAQARSLHAPAALRRALRGDLDRVLLTALDPAPERRYRSASGLAEDLLAVVDGRPISLRGDRRYRFGKFVRRHRWSVAAASVAVVALLATSTIALSQAKRADDRARTALAVKDFVEALLDSASPEVSLGRQLTVREILNRGREQLPRQLDRDPDVGVELLTMMARSYQSLGEERTARALLDQALVLAPQVDVQHRADLHNARMALGIWLGEREAMATEAAQLRALLPQLRDSPLRVTTLLSLADYELAKDPAASEALATEAWRLARDALPANDPRRVTTLRSLGMARNVLGKRGQARSSFTQALATAERYQPRLHPEISWARMNLATHYSAEGQHAQATELARRALDDSVAVYGADSLQTVVNRMWVGRTRSEAGDFRTARPYVERALQLCERAPTQLKVELAAAELALAKLEETAGRLDSAQSLYQRAYEHHAATGIEQYSLPFLRLNIARLMAKRGDVTGADALYRAIADKSRPGGSAQARALSGLGTLARRDGEAANALRLHQRAAGLLSSQPDSPHYRTMRAHALEAKFEAARDTLALGHAAAARARLAAIVRELDAVFAYEIPDLVAAYPELVALGAPDGEARRLLARSLALHELMFGPDDSRTRTARDALAARLIGGSRKTG